MIPDEFQTMLQNWLRENGETLIHIFPHHSGSGGTLYLLKSPDQVKAAIEYAASAAAQYGDGRATITAFRSGYYPLHGNVDTSLIEKIRGTWGGERWYSIVSLEDSFSSPLRMIGSGDTAQEFDNDLADVPIVLLTAMTAPKRLIPWKTNQVTILRKDELRASETINLVRACLEVLEPDFNESTDDILRKLKL